MNHAPQPQENKLGYYFQSETCLGTLETLDFLSFPWSVVCKRPVINVTLIPLKIPTKRQDQLGLELSIDPPPPGGILYTMIF